MNAIQISSDNIYADLGDTQAEEMLIKARLAHKIDEIIQHRHFTQTEAAHLLDLTQATLSDLLRGQFRDISEVKMLDCLNRMGEDGNFTMAPIED